MTQTPWINSYPAPARWDAPLALGPVQAILDEAAERFGDRPAVEFMGKRATYAQLHALANRAAKGFQQLGVGPGVHVGLYLPNTPHYLVAFFGVLKAGGTIVNYSPLDAAQVLAHKIEDSETSILVTLDVPALLPQMEALLGTGRFTTLVVGGLGDLAGFPEYADAGEAVAAAHQGRVPFRSLLANDGAYRPHPIGDPSEAIAVLQYTGGTTGLPKGAILTHGNLTAATSQYMETTRLDPPVLVPGEERTLLVLPLFHIYALTAVMLLCVRLGAEMILHPRFDLEAVVTDLAAKKVSIFMGVPTMFAALLAYPGLGELDLTVDQIHRLRRRAAAAGDPGTVPGRDRLQRQRRLGDDRDVAVRHVHPNARDAQGGLVRHPRPRGDPQVRRRHRPGHLRDAGRTRRDLHPGPQRDEGLLEEP